MFDVAFIVEHGKVTARWDIAARGRLQPALE
jgi:hypothetical protein